MAGDAPPGKPLPHDPARHDCEEDDVERAQTGEADQKSRTSTQDMSPSRRGGKRSGKGPGGRTRDQLYEEARRAIHAREEMMRIVSHDIGNPLSAIFVAAKVARRDLEALSRGASRIGASTSTPRASLTK